VLKGDEEIYCEAGYYDMRSGNAVFLGNPSYKEGEKTAKANEIRYTKTKDEIALYGSASYRSADETATADTILFNERTEDISLIGDGIYIGKEKRVEGELVVFNNKTESVDVEGNGYLSEPPMIIKGEDIKYDSLSGFAHIRGNVTWRDTSKNNTIYGEYLICNDKEETVRVERTNDVRPMLLQELDGDTLYLSADTLIYTTVKTDSTEYKEFTAFPDVRIFKENMSALSEHLYFDDIDSIFVLTGIPVMWSDTSQFSGDTININLVNEKISSLEIMENGFIVNAESGSYYNQISGKDVLAEFKEDYVDNMYVTGNSRSIYYLKDDIGAMIGLNKTDCSRMRFYFQKDSLTDVRFYTEPTSVLTPIAKATDGDLYLDGFQWNIEIKPQSVEDLLSLTKSVKRSASPQNAKAPEEGSTDKKRDGESLDNAPINDEKKSPLPGIEPEDNKEKPSEEKSKSKPGNKKN